MTEPAGVEPPRQYLTGTQRSMLAAGAVPEPTEQQDRELQEFAEHHGLNNGVDFAWITAGRLLMDHYESLLADVRRAHSVTLANWRMRHRDEIARLTALLDAAQLERDKAQGRAVINGVEHGIWMTTEPIGGARSWWRRVVDRLRAVRS